MIEIGITYHVGSTQLTQNEGHWEDRDNFEDLESVETEDDIKVSTHDFEKLLIAPSDWTVGTIYNLIGKQLELDPAYQRRNVWASKAKSQFIESLILGIPIPQILLAARQGKKNSFFVLDGKQRLTAVKEFLDGKYSDGRVFKLKGMRILTELEGMKWSDLQENGWSDSLENEPIRTTVLRGWEDETTLYEIFYRLNSGSVRLSPMELRMSLHPGEFLKFIVSWTEGIGPIHHLLKKGEPDPRMGDVELAIRYLAFQDRELEYAGDLKKFLDEYCSKSNLGFSDEKYRDSIIHQLNQLNASVDSGFSIFGDKNYCRKFVDGHYESRFNRAVFDILSGSLTDRGTREWAVANKETVIRTFQEVSESTPSFVRSLETTTKSIEATMERFSIWYSALSKASGITLELPNIKQ